MNTRAQECSRISSVKDNSVTHGEFMDPLNCKSGVFTVKLRFRWRLGAIRRRYCRSHNEFFKA